MVYIKQLSLKVMKIYYTLNDGRWVPGVVFTKFWKQDRICLQRRIEVKIHDLIAVEMFISFSFITS